MQLSDSRFHILAAIAGAGFGIAWWWLDRPSHFGDIYHHLLVAPLILYLAITLLPVIITKGTAIEKSAVMCLVLLWAALIAFDIKYNRVNQREWLENHGVKLK